MAQLGGYGLNALGDSWWGGSRGADVGDEAFPGVGLPHEANAGVFSCMRLAMWSSRAVISCIDGVEGRRRGGSRNVRRSGEVGVGG